MILVVLQGRRGGRREGSGLGEGDRKAGEVEGSGTLHEGCPAQGPAWAWGRSVGLLEKDGRSPAKRLVWGCPAASRPHPLTALLRPRHTSPAAVTTLS